MSSPNPKGFPSHKQFVESVAGAKISEFTSRPTFSANGSAAFEAMRQHILNFSQDVEVQRSFVDEHGQIFDCVPVEQQPSLKGKNIQVATPIDIESSKSSVSEERRLSKSPLAKGRLDKLGNEMQCPQGTVPIRRITLEEMTRFGSLQEFFRKPPVGRGAIHD